MSKSLRIRIQDYFFIIIVAAISYWPVSTMLFSLKNDALNYFLAVRFNTSEAIQNGIFPAWSPYINMGYPVHGDVQSGVWNPIVILMSLIRKYDIYWLQIETIIAIIIAGISMYHLLTYLKINRKVVLLVSAAYMLNGFIADSGQFINWIYAASFLPFVFQSALQCFSRFSIRYSFQLGLSLSLMFVCAYPADFILLFYLLLVFVLISFFIINKDITLAKRTGLYIRLILQSSVCFLIISLPAIISFIPFFQSVYRGGGVTIDSALSNSLAPINLISFVTPWPTLNATWHQYTDPLIRNCYPGFVLLLFFIYKITNTRKKSNLEWFLIGTIIFFILFSLGEYGGLRVLSFQYLPLMDTFRHPANSKIFFIFSIQLLSAFAINEFLNSSNFENNRFNKIIKIFLLLISIIFIISIYKSNILNIIPSIINNDVPVNTIIIKQIKDNLSFYDLLFLNSLLLLITALLIYFLHKKGILRKFLLPITLSEMAIVVQAMLPLTYVKNLEPAEIQKIINNQPKGYPIPENTISIAEQSIEGNRYFNILGSLNLYNKKPGRVDYVVTPSNLIDQENFWKNKALRDRIIKYPLCYFADTTFNAKDTLAFINFNSDKKAAIIDNINLPTGFGYEGKRNIVIKKFVPGKVYIQASNPSKSLLVFQQNYYYKWDAYVNGKKAKISKVNFSFMAVELPEGANKIELTYNITDITIAGLMSFLFIVGIYIYIYRKKNR